MYYYLIILSESTNDYIIASSCMVRTFLHKFQCGPSLIIVTVIKYCPGGNKSANSRVAVVYFSIKTENMYLLVCFHTCSVIEYICFKHITFIMEFSYIHMLNK